MIHVRLYPIYRYSITDYGVHLISYYQYDLVGLERFTTTKPGLLVRMQPFSKQVFQTLSFDPNVRSVLICGSQDETMLRKTIEEVKRKVIFISRLELSHALLL